MKHTWLSMTILSLSLALLSGCQQQPAKKVTADKVEQVAALIASAEWLRDHCQRSDIPPRSVVEETATIMAKERGWDISGTFQQDVNNAVQRRYLAISKDTLVNNQKCVQLNQVAAPFIHQITALSASRK